MLLNMSLVPSMYHTEFLNRKEYVSSIESIEDSRTSNFANMSLKWWDAQYGWYKKGCIVLCDSHNTHLSYIFFTIDKHNEYITLHNLFTQLSLRRNGYAQELLAIVFNLALQLKVKRFKLTSISNSLDFYLELGFVYWGVTCTGDYYCDLPMPLEGLSGVKEMTENATIETLIGKKFTKIHEKVGVNETQLSQTQITIYEKDLLKMQGKYMLENLHAMDTGETV